MRHYREWLGHPSENSEGEHAFVQVYWGGGGDKTGGQAEKSTARGKVTEKKNNKKLPRDSFVGFLPQLLRIVAEILQYKFRKNTKNP